jgi:OOP family OmpA-OmpF porin
MTMKTSLLLLAACAAFAPASTFADENKGWYVGASLGTSTSDYSVSDAQSNFSYDPGVSVDNSDFGARVFGGFRFNRHLAAEFGVVDLGVTRISGRIGGSASADELAAAGIYGAVVGRLPLEAGISLLGKLGFGVIAGVYTCKQLCPFGDYSVSEVTTAPLLGIGAQFDFARRFAVRVEYEHFGRVEFGGSRNATYNLATAGLLFKF